MPVRLAVAATRRVMSDESPIAIDACDDVGLNGRMLWNMYLVAGGSIVTLLLISLRNTWDLLVTVGEVSLGSDKDEG